MISSNYTTWCCRLAVKWYGDVINSNITLCDAKIAATHTPHATNITDCMYHIKSEDDLYIYIYVHIYTSLQYYALNKTLKTNLEYLKITLVSVTFVPACTLYLCLLISISL